MELADKTAKKGQATLTRAGRPWKAAWAGKSGESGIHLYRNGYPERSLSIAMDWLAAKPRALLGQHKLFPARRTVIHRRLCFVACA